MKSLFAKRRRPIGVDLGSRAVKLLQLSGDGSKVLEAARWELPSEVDDTDPEAHRQALTESLRQALETRNFRGRDAVCCLGANQLFVQNIRVPKPADGNLQPVVQQEAAARVPYSIAEAEIRFLEAADIRQGDAMRREVILLACHREVLHNTLSVIQSVGLRPVAVDVEPTALLRCYERQFRRDEDRTARAIFVHLGATNSVVVIARGSSALFVKYLDIGGQQMDEAVARHLGMPLDQAILLRKHNGDRRADQQDPEVARAVTQAVGSVIDRLSNELSLCIRYHSVTFRGQPLVRMVLGGGEANSALLDAIQQRLDMPCELGDPLRSLGGDVQIGQQGQWEIATGLALRQVA